MDLMNAFLVTDYGSQGVSICLLDRTEASGTGHDACLSSGFSSGDAFGTDGRETSNGPAPCPSTGCDSGSDAN